MQIRILLVRALTLEDKLDKRKVRAPIPTKTYSYTIETAVSSSKLRSY